MSLVAFHSITLSRIPPKNHALHFYLARYFFPISQITQSPFLPLFLLSFPHTHTHMYSKQNCHSFSHPHSHTPKNTCLTLTYTYRSFQLLLLLLLLMLLLLLLLKDSSSRRLGRARHPVHVVRRVGRELRLAHRKHS